MKEYKMWIACKPNGQPLVHSLDRAKSEPLKIVSERSGITLKELRDGGVKTLRCVVNIFPNVNVRDSDRGAVQNSSPRPCCRRVYFRGDSKSSEAYLQILFCRGVLLFAA